MNNFQNVILFDGVCNLCNNSVNFIIDRDRNNKFKFASLQSETGTKLLNYHKDKIPSGTDSIIYIEGNNIYMKSSAALKIAKNLKGLWKLLYVFMVIPSPIRDYVYNIIAKNRYKWFGKENACRIPTPELKSKFLG